MRVLIAGSTGVIGRQLVPLLQLQGHQVIGFSARASNGTDMRVDALDAESVARAVGEIKPDAVVNLMTAIPRNLNPRRLAKDFQMTNVLRTQGLKNLVGAVGSRDVVLVHQGLAYGYRPAPGLANETDPFWDDGPKQFRPVIQALQRSEDLTREAGGTVLRFGHLYGPGTAFDADGSFTASVKARKVPLVGGGHAVFSFTHTRDAASAITRVIDTEAREEVFNIVDDNPSPLHEWLPVFADRLMAKPPKPAPTALARMAVGGWGVAYLNELRGATNARARARLGWEPTVPSWSTELGNDH
jgi:nucleoside-diphosphate-sugar epimerase